MTEKEIYLLAQSIYRHIDGSADDADIVRIDVWKNKSDGNVHMLEKFTGEEFIYDIAAELKQYDANKAYENFIRRKRNASLKRRMRNVAAILLPLIAAGGSLLLFQEQNRTQTYNPSENAVILTLSDDREIRLNDLYADELRDNERVFANYGESLNYAETEPAAQKPTKSTDPIFHTLTVPRGKEYTIILSDGSSVKLNAQSKMKYPIPFDEDRREVEITGEAYFRVSPDSAKPFIVKTANYDILVTGTEFNVRSYPENHTATTLVSGSVMIARNDMVYELAPGQQAVDTDKGVSIRNVNPDSYIAWEHGEFMFSNKPLSYIMSEISNWYDIEEIIFEQEDAKELLFSAGFRKSKSLEDILETLEATGIIKIRYSHGRIKVSCNHK